MIPVELSWTQKVTSGAGALHHWGKAGWWGRQHLTWKVSFFDILRGQHGCTWVKLLPANKNVLLWQNVTTVFLALFFEGMGFNWQILSAPQPAWRELVNDKDHWHSHSPTSLNAQLLFGWLLPGRNQLSASPLELMEGTNSRLNAALLCFMRLSPMDWFLRSNLAEQTSGTCKQPPRFRHLVITRTERVFVLQFIITRVGRAALQAGQSETATGTGGTGHPQWHRLQGQSSLWCFMTVQCVCRSLGLKYTYPHWHTCSTTHHGCTYACTWWYPTFSVHFSVHHVHTKRS